MKFIIILKRNLLSIIFCLFTISLVIFSNESLSAAKSGLLLWANSVIPSLLPFFIATELLLQTNIVDHLGRFLNFIMRPLFNVPGIGGVAFIMGIISGYPIGAKISADLREQNLITKTEATRLISFTNNSGPLFIIGTVGIFMFGNSLVGILLFITHILASLSVGFLFRFYNLNDNSNYTFSKKTYYNKSAPNISIGDMLSKSISNAINHIVIIGGFIVLFSVVLSILKETRFLQLLSSFLYPIFNLLNVTEFTNGFVCGIVELTNGLNQITSINIKAISTNIIFCAFLLGFGSVSILFQVLSIVSKTDISIKPYIYAKLLHGFLAAIYTFLFIHHFAFLNLNI